MSRIAREKLEAEGRDGLHNASEVDVNRLTGFRNEESDTIFSKQFDSAYGTSHHRETTGRRKLYGSKQWEDEINKSIERHNRIYGGRQ